jgi:hypothetical protein
MTDMDAFEFVSLSPARNMCQRVRYSIVLMLGDVVLCAVSVGPDVHVCLKS